MSIIEKCKQRMLLQVFIVTLSVITSGLIVVYLSKTKLVQLFKILWIALELK